MSTEISRVKVSKQTNSTEPRIAWHKINDTQRKLYKSHISSQLGKLKLSDSPANCNNVKCVNVTHKQELNDYCAALIDVCLTAGIECFPKVRSKNRNVPYWSEKVRPYKDEALKWSRAWKTLNKPSEGEVYENMKKAKHEYHYSIRKIRKDENNLRRARMAECVAQSDNRNLWREIKKVSANRKVGPAHIDNCIEDRDIVEQFARKYKKLYNSVTSKDEALVDINNYISEELENYSGKEHCVTVPEVQRAVEKLKIDKSDGQKGLIYNHIKLAPPLFNIHVSLMMTGMTVHGFTPDDMIKGTLVCLPKDICGDICDSDNYRGICLCSSICKIYEWILISRYTDKLQTSNVQFSFKKEHSTTTCSLTLKEVITYYLNRESNVYACFIDASKAFDRIRHDQLFDILRKRGIPPIILRMIIDMYSRKSSKVMWNGVHSANFSASNGVRQGGIASPILFTVYIDELLKRLERTGIGCMIGHEWFGALGYADDITLLCPSIQGLQELVNVCSDFGHEYDIIYNPKKSMCMTFSRKIIDNSKRCINLNGQKLKWVNHTKYLGNYITENLSESLEINKKRSDLIARLNSLLYRVGYATKDVLMKLLNANAHIVMVARHGICPLAVCSRF